MQSEAFAKSQKIPWKSVEKPKCNWNW